MKFRPCIDIHNGKVKQIVGTSLRDQGDTAKENFVSEKGAAYFAGLYKRYGLSGGHVILLNSRDSVWYEKTREQAYSALAAYPGGLQAGGGISAENAKEFLKAGASHVIVTSYVFQGGRILEENLQKLVQAVGKERLVLDISCKRRGGDYFVVTDRWQKETELQITPEFLQYLAGYCSEFLVHAADAEGKSGGLEENLVRLLSSWKGIPITYAGGVHDFSDLEKLRQLGEGKIDVTIGSALSLFGGNMDFEKVAGYGRE